MLTDIKKRLESFGYTPTEEDTWPLQFIARKVEQDILDNCGLDEFPEGLHATAVDMAVGEFLLGKKATPEGLAGFNLEQAEKSISLGDTKVDFGEGTKTQEQRLDALITHLLKGKGNNFARYRRIVW